MSSESVATATFKLLLAIRFWQTVPGYVNHFSALTVFINWQEGRSACKNNRVSVFPLETVEGDLVCPAEISVR